MVAMVLTLDLKILRQSSLGFLRLILMQIGLPYRVIKWIMSSVNSINNEVIINGIPTEFFWDSRGLCQGWSLSPFLFWLVIKGLIILISKDKSDGRIKGIKFGQDLKISHMLFVDDIMIFGIGSGCEWSFFSDIIELFCNVLSMSINQSKLELLESKLDSIKIAEIKIVF